MLYVKKEISFHKDENKIYSIAEAEISIWMFALVSTNNFWSREIRLTDEQDGKCKNFFVVMVIELKYWNFEKLFSPISIFIIF